MNKKRSLIGYHPKMAQEFADSLQLAFVEEKNRIEAELVILTDENTILAERIGELTKNLSIQPVFEQVDPTNSKDIGNKQKQAN
jgi:uncharacterized protein (DUF2344 family)